MSASKWAFTPRGSLDSLGSGSSRAFTLLALLPLDSYLFRFLCLAIVFTTPVSLVYLRVSSDSSTIMDRAGLSYKVPGIRAFL